MSDNTIPSATTGNIIPAAHHNGLRTALSEDHVPRNSSAVATNEAGSLGTSALRWLNGYIKKIFVGATADNISLEADGSDLLIKVGGNERARIPQSIELLPPGMIVAYSGTSDPSQWFICDGREVSRTTYARLYTAIGDAYGEGNGTTTFNLPDFRGRFLRAADDPGNGTGAASRDPDAGSRTAMSTGGNTGNNIGSVQGDEFKQHNHDTNSRPGRSTSDTGDGIQGFDLGQAQTTNGISGDLDINNAGTSSETRPKNAYVNYIIKT